MRVPDQTVFAQVPAAFSEYPAAAPLTYELYPVGIKKHEKKKCIT